MKVVLVILSIIIFGYVFWYDKQKGSFDYDYEGADETGYYYPDEVREDFIKYCIEEMEETDATEEQKKKFCSCGLDLVEDKYSFKEFDNKFGATSPMLKFFAKTVPPDIANAMKETCVKQIKK
jgi:D-alanine-D-alanine ligase-like ATP-grasp enzyme|tara:strand:- start:699 stop:1067 length:369 start_codon:yes stop_codon:yes gene_type:complete